MFFGCNQVAGDSSRVALGHFAFSLRTMADWKQYICSVEIEEGNEAPGTTTVEAVAKAFTDKGLATPKVAQSIAMDDIKISDLDVRAKQVASEWWMRPQWGVRCPWQLREPRSQQSRSCSRSTRRPFGDKKNAKKWRSSFFDHGKVFLTMAKLFYHTSFFDHGKVLLTMVKLF